MSDALPDPVRRQAPQHRNDPELDEVEERIWLEQLDAEMERLELPVIERLIARHEALGEQTPTELAELLGISRKTYYKHLARLKGRPLGEFFAEG